MTTNATDSADAIISRLDKACRGMGLETKILEPSTKIRINVPHGDARMAEVVTLKPDTQDVLCFWWSWDEAICPADDIDYAVKMISGVVSITST